MKKDVYKTIEESYGAAGAEIFRAGAYQMLRMLWSNHLLKYDDGVPLEIKPDKNGRITKKKQDDLIYATECYGLLHNPVLRETFLNGENFDSVKFVFNNKTGKFSVQVWTEAELKRARHLPESLMTDIMSGKAEIVDGRYIVYKEEKEEGEK